jgi:fatty acid desaturase
MSYTAAIRSAGSAMAPFSSTIHAQAGEETKAMTEVQPRARSALWGLIAVILAAGWATFGILGGGQVFLAIMVALSILLTGIATFLVRVRRS